MKKKIWLSLFGGTGTGIMGIFGLSICCLPAAAGFSGILGIIAVFSYKYSIYLLIAGAALLFISLLLFSKRKKQKKIKLKSTITCPNCKKRIIEEMPTNSCLFFYDCPECKKTIKPKKGDCCVFCSYGNNPCPPKQQKCNC
ncbi:hypothetical protein N9O56_01130 [Rickettsiales bacterium]|nr:hypothetical protein [Rickettsiales bacterium]